MLTKNTDLIVDPADPFKHDCLSRKDGIIDLTNLIQSASQPFVISVQAPWGWGKTSFVRMWKAHLELEKHPCLYFNAWSNDFAEDPLIAFIGEMSTLLNGLRDKGKNADAKKALANARKIGGQLARKSVPVIVRVATQGIIDEHTIELIKGAGDEIGELMETLAKDSIKAYEDKKRSIAGFRESLQKFTQAITAAEDRRSPLVIFVDELDRCRPDYAIALLERIKHLFDIEGVVFILSIDYRQLVNSVKAIYGSSMDADGYLRRFIDVRYELPFASTEAFCTTLWERFKLNDVFEGRNQDRHYHRDRFEAENLQKIFMELASKFQLSLRVQEQCFTQIKIVLETTGNNYNLFPDLLAFLVAVKAYNPEVYAMFQKPDTDIDVLLERVRKILAGNKNLERYVEPMVAAQIILSSMGESDVLSPKVKDLQTIAESSEDDPRKERAQEILRIINKSSYNFNRNTIPYVVSRIENLGKKTK